MIWHTVTIEIKRPRGFEETNGWETIGHCIKLDPMDAKAEAAEKVARMYPDQTVKVIGIRPHVQPWRPALKAAE